MRLYLRHEKAIKVWQASQNTKVENRALSSETGPVD